jgi:hypothetical protein
MQIATLMMVFGGLLIAAAFVSAYKVRALKHLKGNRQQTLFDFTGVMLAAGLLVLCEATLQRFAGTSFYHLWRSGSNVPFQLFLAGALEGIVYEYVGQFVFPCWLYPAAEVRRWLLLGLPFFWGVFMLIMQDTWAIWRHAGAPVWTAWFLTAMTQYAAIEGFNLIGHSWKYLGAWRRVPTLIAGWLALSFTFVVAYNHYFGRPFGL